MQRYPYISPKELAPKQLRHLREANGVSISHIARESGLTRVTVGAAEGNADARLSTVLALFDTLGYNLYPVPKSMATEVAAFVANGGEVVTKPAGEEAPVNDSLAAFKRRVLDSKDSDDVEGAA